MKQLRVISNLVAEELKQSLKAQNISLDESAFEERVSGIVEMLNNAIAEGCGKGCSKSKNEGEEPEDDEGQANEAGKTNENDDGPEDGEMFEDADMGDVYYVESDITAGDTSISAGDFIEVVEIDFDNDSVVINIYDDEGEVKSENMTISTADMDQIEANSEEVEIDEANESASLREGIHFRGGKKVTFSAKIEKLKAKLAAKKGASGPNKFKISNGKIVKKSSDEYANDRKKSKTFAKKMKRFVAKRIKSFKKSMKANSSSASGTASVKEGFDITSGAMTFALEAGDTLTVIDNTVTVVREGKEIVKGLEVSEDFINRCVSEGVIDYTANAVSEGNISGESVSENASMLTYKTDCGFVLVKEGSEVPLGNRVRARGYLMNEGYSVTAEMLDNAVNGKEVVL